MGVQNLGCRAGKWRPADQTAKEDCSERIDICLSGHGARACALFGRHVGGRTNCSAFAGQFRRIQRAGDAEIGEQRRDRLIGSHSARFSCQIVRRTVEQPFSLVDCRGGQLVSLQYAEGIGVDRSQQDIAGFHISMDDSL